MSDSIKHSYLAGLVKQALAEDIGSGDITTNGVGDQPQKIKATISAQANGVLAGMMMVKEVYRQLDKRIKIINPLADGRKVKPATKICTIEGLAQPILTGERTALNFLGLLSGIATTTNQFAHIVKGTKTKILDTRKTIPGLRQLTKYAVKMGGGINHRMGLFDAILIKDNHIEMAGSITQAISNCRKKYGHKKLIEVEVETISQVYEAIDNKAQIILLDNFKLPQLKKAIRIIDNQAQTEISGSVTLKTLQTYAKLGVDRISVGAITHSSPWLPLHMEFE